MARPSRPASDQPANHQHGATHNGSRQTDTQLKRRLEQAFGDSFSAPLRQRGDTTEIWIGAGDLTEVMRRLREDEQFEFELLADLCGVDTGTEMWVVYHLYSPRTSDWLRVVAADDRRLV